MSGETIKQYIEDNLFRGCYETANETPLGSPFQFILWLAYQQYQRNKRCSTREDVQAAAAGE